MLATRSILRTVAQNPVAFRNSIATVHSYGVRHFNATPRRDEQCAAAESELLREQRKRRPVSPHLQIYQPQLTWYMSGAHRVTGAALGGLFYLSAMAYVAAPAFGVTIDTASIISSVAAAPFAAKFAAKTIVGFPFVFHCLNGIRHLVWDATKMLDIKDVYRSGYAVLGATAVGTIALAAM
ncbi:succinate dehydrogenase cytochrome b560 subunit [Mycotypha africana]|uniref:succinate dehydrogenase cytochrome b560 subunit n=1 Tax=Mycotypha africana TaxID=64632 RepID=UPI002300B90D|nr:succinate dehydrogenase cytochrome b560 subunit [Mycotypha africana]KAI8992006.1 succinate dehydrogenase cytochrome b560 subunit [Mycotypha africana]